MQMLLFAETMTCCSGPFGGSYPIEREHYNGLRLDGRDIAAGNVKEHEHAGHQETNRPRQPPSHS